MMLLMPFRICSESSLYTPLAVHMATRSMSTPRQQASPVARKSVCSKSDLTSWIA